MAVQAVARSLLGAAGFHLESAIAVRTADSSLSVSGAVSRAISPRLPMQSASRAIRDHVLCADPLSQKPKLRSVDRSRLGPRPKRSVPERIITGQQNLPSCLLAHPGNISLFTEMQTIVFGTQRANRTCKRKRSQLHDVRGSSTTRAGLACPPSPLGVLGGLEGCAKPASPDRLRPGLPGQC
jgi:hypothetical protein